MIWLIAICAVSADEESDARAELEQLKADMARLSEELKVDKAERGSLRAALRQSELSIGRIKVDIRRTQESLKQVQSQLAEMEAERQELLTARGQQQELIARELQTAYQMGRQSQIKIMLNQQAPDTLARSLGYYEYFYEARKKHIESYLQTIEQINNLEPEIELTATQLSKTEEQLSRQQVALVEGKQQRERDLARLNASIETKDQRLAKMAADRQELEALLEAIEEAVANIAIPDSYQAFADLKGTIPWPLAGKPSNRYGSRRNDQMRWQGLSIPATEGTTVNAIHHGRVVFADWFRGSGLLLIIDHGDGFMSLYAHNQALLREVGEWVPTGAAISTVGNSGGQNQAALYFEIRQNGKPTNPGNWLKRG